MARKRFPSFFVGVLTLGLLLFNLGPRDAAAQASPAQIRQAIEEAGSYRYSADITQTLIPRATADNIGKSEQVVLWRIAGETIAPDQTAMQIELHDGGFDTRSVSVIQNGERAFVRSASGLEPVEQATDVIAPTTDFFDYIPAGDALEWVEEQTIGGVTVSHYRFALDGATLSAAISKNSGASSRMTPVLDEAEGTGEIWVDDNGLVRRLAIDMTLPRIDAQHHAHWQMRIDFRNYGKVDAVPQVTGNEQDGWQVSGDLPPVGGGSPAPGAHGTSISAPLAVPLQKALPDTLLVLALALAMVVMARVYLRWRRATYGVIVSSISLLMVGMPLLQAAGQGRYAVRAAQAADEPNPLLEALGVQPAPVQSGASTEPQQAQGDDWSRLLHEESAPARGSVLPNSAPGGPNFVFADSACGSGEPGVDSDFDGLSDIAELCLGTNRYAADSDFDSIPDKVEIEGFQHGGRTWTTNPLQADSNGDGIYDTDEWLFPNGKAEHLDGDGDGVPAPWDDDNDNDQVPDGQDLSPFEVRNDQTMFKLRAYGRSDFDGYRSVEIQVRPVDPDHLRYTTTFLDWPSDYHGQMRDMDHSVEDIQLVPYLEVLARETPSEVLREKYGILVEDAPDWINRMLRDSNGDLYKVKQWLGSVNKLRIPLFAQGEGTVDNFLGKIVYGPEAGEIWWKTARLSWLVMGQVDDYCPLDLESVCTEPQVLHTYYEPFHLTGMRVALQESVEMLTLGTPSTPQDDTNLMHILSVLGQTFLTAEEMENQAPGRTALQEIANRFTEPTPITYTWGIDTAAEPVAVDYQTFGHADEAMAMSAESTQAFLENNFPQSAYDDSPCTDAAGEEFRCAGLIMALQQRQGSIAMADVRIGPTTFFQLEGSYMNVDLSHIPMLTERSARYTLYERNAMGWDATTPARMMELIEWRYAGELDGVDQDILARDPEANPVDSRTMMYTLYLAASAGVNSVTQIDDIPLVEPEADETGLAAAGAFGALGSTIRWWVVQRFNILKFVLTGPLDLDTEVAKRSTGFKGDHVVPLIVLSLAAVDLAVNAAGAVCAALEATEADSQCDAEALAVTNTINSGLKNSGRAMGIAANFATTEKLKNLFRIKNTLNYATSIGLVTTIVSFVIGVVTIWTVFTIIAATTGEATVVQREAVKAAAATALSIIYLGIGLLGVFLPVVGVLFAAFLLADFFVGWILNIAVFKDGRQHTLTGMLIELLVEAESADLVTKPGPIYFEGMELEFGTFYDMMRKDAPVVGNTMILADTFVGKVERNDEDVSFRYAYAYGAYHAEEVDGIVAATDTNAPAESDFVRHGEEGWIREGCQIDPDENLILVCRNEVGMRYRFLTAQPNLPLIYNVEVRFEYNFEGCESTIFAECSHDDSGVDVKKVELPKDGDEASYRSTIYIDVYPQTLEEFWNWDALHNPDRDGDGLHNDAEASEGTLPDDWDSDNDGLADGFEVEQKAVLGTNPLSHDSDRDALPDGLELQRGTSPGARDSDGDGLWDRHELYRVSGGEPRGGWEVIVPDLGAVRVYPNPLTADADKDRVVDATEQFNGTSPYAVNYLPGLYVRAEPSLVAPDGRRGVFVKPGDPVTTTTTLLSAGPQAVTTTLELCLPAGLANLSGGQMQGSRTPPAGGGPCMDGGAGYEWTFNEDPTNSNLNHTLHVGGVVSATITGQADPSLSESVTAPISATLPYGDEMVVAGATLYVDADDPSISFHAPAGDAVLRGVSYVVGGVAADPTSWVAQVQVDLDDGNGFVNTVGVSPWAQTWMLPEDGVYDLRARAIDAFGRTSPIARRTVTVDNTPPEATLDLAAGTVIGETGGNYVFGGAATDNLSGVARVQVQIDGGQWQEATLSGSGGSVSWQYDWAIGLGAQGTHPINVRAVDVAGNTSEVQVVDVVVDVTPPTSELTRALNGSNVELINTTSGYTVSGIANDLGNASLPARPAALQGELSGLTDATVWLSPDSVADDDGGVSLTWLGDVNGDGRGDLALGFPAAEGGAGRIDIVTGRDGDWPVPPDVEALGDSRDGVWHDNFVGADGAGIGAQVSAPGDVNGDSLDDILVGDPLNDRVFFIYGSVQPFGLAQPLDEEQFGDQLVLQGPAGSGFGGWVAPAGDVDGDGLADFFAGGGNGASLILGVSITGLSDALATEQAALVVGNAGVRMHGVGDVDGDQLDEFVVVDGSNALGGGVGLYLIADVGELTPGAQVAFDPTAASTAFFASSGFSHTPLAALGDVNGDELSDFLFSSGGAPQLVLGRESGAWGVDVSLGGYVPAADGFLAAPGDVNADGLADMILGTSADSAYLVYGQASFTGAPAVAATLTDVAGAASTPHASGADANCDFSSDLLLLPAQAGVQQLQEAQIDFGATAFVDPDNLPRAAAVSVATPRRELGPDGAAAVDALFGDATLYVDDDGVCDGNTPCHATLQAAVNAAAAGDVVGVYPGVYAPVVVGPGKDNLEIAGVNADAVFIEGGGGAAAVEIRDVSGVMLSHLTIRDAAVTVLLANAGVNGHAVDGDKIVLDTVLLHDFGHAVEMDRQSTLRMQNSTVAGEGDAAEYIRVTGSPDPEALPEWTVLADLPSDNFEPVGAGGRLVRSASRIYAVPTDNGLDSARYDIDADEWVAITDMPEIAATGWRVPVVGGNQLSLERNWGFGDVIDGNVYELVRFEAQDEDEDDALYVGGDFAAIRINGDTIAGTKTIARWQNDEWSPLGEGTNGTVHAITTSEDGRYVYVGGNFTEVYQPNGAEVSTQHVARWDWMNNEWTPMPLFSGGFVLVNVLAVGADGILYAAGDFSVGGDGIEYVAGWNPVAGQWEELLSLSSFFSGDNGWIDGELSPDGWSLYLAGEVVRTGDIPMQAARLDFPQQANELYSFHPIEPDTTEFGNGYPRAIAYDPVTANRPVLLGGDWTQILVPDAGGGFELADQYSVAQIEINDDAVPFFLGYGNPGLQDFSGPSGGPALVRAIAPLGLPNRSIAAGEFEPGNIVTYSYNGGVSPEWNVLDGGLNGAVHTLLVDGAGEFYPDVYAGGEFTQMLDPQIPVQKLVRYARTIFNVDDNTWDVTPLMPRSAFHFTMSRFTLSTRGASSDDYFVTSETASTYRVYHDLGGSPQLVGTYTEGSGLFSDKSTVAYAGGVLYLLVDEETFLRFDPGDGSWTTLPAVPGSLGTTAAMSWDGGAYLYLVGGGSAFYRYHIASGVWTNLGNGPGAGSGNDLVRVGDTLYMLLGNGHGFQKYGPVGAQRVKLELEDVAFVAPENQASATWYTLDDDSWSDDFAVSATNLHHVAGSATSWSPAAPNPLTVAEADFFDVENDVYRVGSASTLASGYSTFVPPITLTTVSTMTIQEAIDSGASEVRLTPGVYEGGFYLVSGARVVGSGAENTVLTAPATGNPGALVRGEGVRGAFAGLFTLAGDGVIDGLALEDGASGVSLQRAIVRNTAEAVTIDGGMSVEIANNTLVGNVNGVAAGACGDIDVRNTVFASHTGTALSYESCAATQLHRYNAYWANSADFRINGVAVMAPGPGELFGDPFFTDPAAHNYRPQPFSPLIDAGAPGDPAPPGTGERVDIGYIENGQANVYADDDYCATCLNDGLVWQIDAFDTIQGAVDAIAQRIATLGKPGDGQQYSVGVGPGSYAEQVALTSHTRLVCSGPEQTIIDGDGGVALTIDAAVHVSVEGCAIHNSGTAIQVGNSANRVTILRNLITNNDDAIVFLDRGSGRVLFNTVADNGGDGLRVDGDSWVSARNNIFHENTGDDLLGIVRSDYNIARNYQAVQRGEHDLTAFPDFVDPDNGDYRLQPQSAAVDSAEFSAAVPPGGGRRADRGYSELRAVPLALLFGAEGQSCGEGNAGVGGVEVAFLAIDDVGRPLTETVPSSWQPATLASPGQTASYWSAEIAPDEGLYRLFTRASDVVGNVEEDLNDWFEGHFRVDNGAPDATLLAPAAGPTTEAALVLQGQTTASDAASVAFMVNDAPYPASWLDGATESPRRFVAVVPVVDGSYGLRARVTDLAGNEGMSDETVVMVSTPDHLVSVGNLANGGATMSALTLNGYVRFANSDGAGEVTVAVDGGAPQQTTLADPDALVSAWSIDLTVAGAGGHTLEVVAARNGVPSTLPVTINFEVDDTPPVVSVAEPSAGEIVTPTVAFSGDVSDAESGVALVELSADGGASWQPAFFDQDGWNLTWQGDITLDSGYFPIRIRATDAAGNETVIAHDVVVDADPPFRLTPITYSSPIGTHFDSFADLGVTWVFPLDDADFASDLVDINQHPTQILSDVPGETTYYTRTLDANGLWYAHVAAEDTSGNILAYHFGPWYVGSFAEPGQSCAARQQTIIVDGYLDFMFNEWLASENLGTEERRMSADEAFYATWDADELFLAWQGTHWDVDGEMWAYLDFSAGGTTTAIDGRSLPFAADRAVQITSATDGALWAYSGGSWQQGALNFVQGGGGETEIVVPWTLTAVNEFNALAYALDNEGAPSAVFPTSNVLDGTWTSAYNWNNLCAVQDVSTGQPGANTLALLLESTPLDGTVLGEGAPLEYVVSVVNQDQEAVSDVAVELSATNGISYQAVDGATCSDCPAGGDEWMLSIAELAPLATAVFTLSAQLDDDLSAVAQVTQTVTLPGSNLAPERLAHWVDSTPPTLEVHTSPGPVLGAGLQPVTGVAEDAGNGDAAAGVALVEYRAAGAGAWSAALGADLWTAAVNAPADGEITLEFRATDHAGNAGAPESVTFIVDTTAPTLDVSVPQVISATTTVLSGTATDPAPEGGQVERIEFQLDNGDAKWQPASVLSEPDGNGVQTWLVELVTPSEDVVAHTLRLRAVDFAGNVETTPWITTDVDNVAPVITATQVMTDVVSEEGVAHLQVELLTGTVTDKAGVATLEVLVYRPDGIVTRDELPVLDETWRYTADFAADDEGVFIFRILATDNNGNMRVDGPYLVSVGGPDTGKIYLPYIVSGVAPDTPEIHLPFIAND